MPGMREKTHSIGNTSRNQKTGEQISFQVRPGPILWHCNHITLRWLMNCRMEKCVFIYEKTKRNEDQKGLMVEGIGSSQS